MRKTDKPGAGEIHLAIPPRIRAKLEEIAGFTPLDAWVRNLIIRAAEEAQPSLKRSGLWHMHVSEWGSRDDEKG